MTFIQPVLPFSFSAMTESLINQLRTLSHEVKLDLDQGRYLITEYCDKLRYDVFAATESAIEHLNKLNDNLIKSIDQYETELMDSFELKSKSSDDKLREMKQLAARCEEMIRKYEIDPVDDEALLNDKASELLSEIKSAGEWVRDEFVFGGNHVHFVETDAFFEASNCFGFLQKSQTSAVRKGKFKVDSFNRS